MITIHSDDESGRSDNDNGKNAKNPTPGNWQVRFSKLQKFKEAHGHVDPNNDYMKRKRPGLSQFIKNQLRKNQEGKLSQSKRDQLEALGVDFTVDDVATALEKDCKIEKGEDASTKEGSETVKKNMWRKKYAALVEFHRKNGTCDVPADHPLAKWVQLQKRRFVKLQKNSPKRVKLLNEIGFDWGKQSATTTMTPSEKKNHHNGLFRKKLALLHAFKDEHGHCNVPADHPELGRWVKSLRARYASGGLQKNHPEKVEKLNELGIEWKSKDDATPVDGTVVSKQGRQELFPKKLALLRDFKDEHGNCNVPKNHPELGRWVQFLRAGYASGRLKKKNPGMVDELDTLGFEWDANNAPENNRSSSFEEKLDVLRAFNDEHGHCNVPADHPELGHWVKSLRTSYASGVLQKKHPNVVDKLTALGFMWSHQEDTVTATSVRNTTLAKNSVHKNRGNGWGIKVRMLKEYKKKTGNSIPPKDHELGPWVRLVRSKYLMIQKHYPELLEDSGDAISSQSFSSTIGGENKKSLLTKVN